MEPKSWTRPVLVTAQQVQVYHQIQWEQAPTLSSMFGSAMPSHFSTADPALTAPELTSFFLLIFVLVADTAVVTVLE